MGAGFLCGVMNFSKIMIMVTLSVLKVIELYT